MELKGKGSSRGSLSPIPGQGPSFNRSQLAKLKSLHHTMKRSISGQLFENNGIKQVALMRSNFPGQGAELFIFHSLCSPGWLWSHGFSQAP